MAFCGTCGTKYETGRKFCPSCGAPAAAPVSPVRTAPPAGAAPPVNTIPPAAPAQPMNAVPPAYGTPVYDAQKDAQDNKVMGILAYIIFLIPLFAGPKDSKFVRFHTNQGFVVFLCAVAYGILYTILSSILFAISWRIALAFSSIFSLVGWVFTIWCILGIINVCKGEMKPLPLIGSITILK